MTDPVVPVSATLLIRMSDGSEQEIEFHEGSEMQVAIKHDDPDGGWDVGRLALPSRPRPLSVSVKLNIDYPAISRRPDGAFYTVTTRTAP